MPIHLRGGLLNARPSDGFPGSRLLAIGFRTVKQGTIRDENCSAFWGWNSG